MSFIDTQMPRRIAAMMQGGPEWKTTVVQMENGREQRNRDWLYPRWRYQANVGAFTAADRQTLMSLFVAAGGRWAAFRFRDPTDNTVTNEPLSPSVGTTTAVQLVRTYSFGAQDTTVLIQAPEAGSVTIYENGVPVPGTLDATTGLFTPDSAWGAGSHTWTGRYDRWVRFESDWGAFTAVSTNYYTADIELVEVRRATS